MLRFVYRWCLVVHVWGHKVEGICQVLSRSSVSAKCRVVLNLSYSYRRRGLV